MHDNAERLIKKGNVVEARGTVRGRPARIGGLSLRHEIEDGQYILSARDFEGLQQRLQVRENPITMRIGSQTIFIYKPTLPQTKD